MPVQRQRLAGPRTRGGAVSETTFDRRPVEVDAYRPAVVEQPHPLPEIDLAESEMAGNEAIDTLERERSERTQ